MNETLIHLASTQGFAITRAQLTRSSDDGLPGRLLRDGLLQRFAPGVYVVPDPPMDLVSRLQRLSLCSSETLIACGPTSAALHGFGQHPSDKLHVTSARGRSLHLPQGVVGRQFLPRSPWMSFDGIHVLDPADTAIDVARAGARPAVLATLDDAARAGVDTALLEAALLRAVGLRGTVGIQELIGHVSPLSESPMESRTRQVLIEAGFVDVEPQVEVEVGGRRRRLDLAFRTARVGVEYDGEEFHTGDGSLARDRERHNDLIAAGWIVIHLTHRDLRRPAEFLRRLAEILASRGYTRPT